MEQVTVKSEELRAGDVLDLVSVLGATACVIDRVEHKDGRAHVVMADGFQHRFAHGERVSLALRGEAE
ncbi:hypothetical protein [Caudoviricetes sp.]|nr:hypothetical protein [Caudoviricetes sp.]